MPFRETVFASGQYYHVYNRGVASQPVFLSKRDYLRFLATLSYYQFQDPPLRLSKLLQLPKDTRESYLAEMYKKKDKIVEVIAYCFMPNHFHLLLKQVKQNGVSRFLRLSVNSYAKYFNTKHERPGSLFQDMFKAVRIENDEQLVHVSRYIHINPLVSYLVSRDDLLAYPWSSLNVYVLGQKNQFVVRDIVLSNFTNGQEYLRFCLDQEDYGKKLEYIKHLTLEKK